ncbi:MAG: NEW3 domain-containing protein [Candidatus Limnocylindrales bacterium]
MRLLRTALVALVLGMAALPAAFLPVAAQTDLSMTTAFPSVVADPGADVAFIVNVRTAVSTRVDLTVVSQPEGWSTRLRGGGSTIAAVTTTPTAEVTTSFSAQFNVEVTVAADVQPGSNQVVMEGRTAAGATSRLTLDIVTEAQEAGSVGLEADFPSLRGSTDATFSFNLTLRNDTNTQQTFSLETDPPAGWDVTAQPTSEDQAATAVVDAGDTTTVRVTAEAPAAAPAGTYPIVVRAVSESASAEAELSVEITGNYSMALDTVDGRLNARVTAGSPTVLNLVLNNTGSAPLTNVELAATPPRGWTVTFSPEAIDQVPSTNAPVNVTATITSATDALAGDYVLTIRANASESNTSDSIEVRTTVETSPIGYLIGIAILVLVAIGLFVVFQRYGRR